MSRSVLSLADLSAEDLREVLDARQRAEPGSGQAGFAGFGTSSRPLDGQVVAVLADRSPDGAAPWIAAAERLGAGVLRAADLAADPRDPFDAALEAARWADLLVVADPLAGFARAVADLTGRPVVNAGEHAGECPVAGLSLLLASPRGEDGTRLRVAVCGDLAGNPGARSYLEGLATVGAVILLVPARGRDLPDAAVLRLARRMGRSPRRFEARAMSSLLDMVDTVLLAPEEAPQLPLFRELDVPPDEAARRARRQVEELDVLYVAAAPGSPDRLVLDPFGVRGPRTRAAGRAPERTSRAPVRHGLRFPAEGAEHRPGRSAFELLLRLAAKDAPAAAPAPSPLSATRYRSALGILCRADGCAAARRPDLVVPDFEVEEEDAAPAARGTADAPQRGTPDLAPRGTVLLRCLHCGDTERPLCAASKLERRVHDAGTADARKILPANRVWFRDRAEAYAAGFEPPRPRRRERNPERMRDGGPPADDRETEHASEGRDEHADPEGPFHDPFADARDAVRDGAASDVRIGPRAGSGHVPATPASHGPDAAEDGTETPETRASGTTET